MAMAVVTASVIYREFTKILQLSLSSEITDRIRDQLGTL